MCVCVCVCFLGFGGRKYGIFSRGVFCFLLLLVFFFKLVKVLETMELFENYFYKELLFTNGYLQPVV